MMRVGEFLNTIRYVKNGFSDIILAEVLTQDGISNEQLDFDGACLDYCEVIQLVGILQVWLETGRMPEPETGGNDK